MSKRKAKFLQNSSWANPSDKPKQWRSGASNGSHSMADGGTTSNSESQKLRIITQVKVWHKEGKLDDMVKCPFCGTPVSVKNFERHVKRKH